MQIASRQPLWTTGGRGTVVEVEMTPSTNLYIRFRTNAWADKNVRVSWGDGNTDEYPYTTNEIRPEHTYSAYGHYRIVLEGIRCIGFRYLDGESRFAYDASVTSIVDYAGQIVDGRSGSFQRAVNLKRYIAPNLGGMGQRDLAYCSNLEEVVIGNCGSFYDGTFQDCSKLVKFTTGRAWTCWSYVWQGCTSLTELKLGDVDQFATRDFANTPMLKDIWIANKTVAQIMQTAPSGNIIAGYGARFPWGACADCRFHGTDGIVLGNGTVINE